MLKNTKLNKIVFSILLHLFTDITCILDVHRLTLQMYRGCNALDTIYPHALIFERHSHVGVNPLRVWYEAYRLR